MRRWRRAPAVCTTDSAQRLVSTIPIDEYRFDSIVTNGSMKRVVTMASPLLSASLFDFESETVFGHHTKRAHRYQSINQAIPNRQHDPIESNRTNNVHSTDSSTTSDDSAPNRATLSRTDCDNE
jgi:hypothetical protein